MTTSTPLVDTRPGGHSAKNAHRAGAPNHLQGSGETPMVSTSPTTVPTVAQLQDHLIAHKRGWLATYPHMAVSFTALAELVHETLTLTLADSRSVTDELIREIVLLEAELADLRAERDTLARESELRESEIITLTVERDRAEAQLAELDTTDGQVRR